METVIRTGDLPVDERFDSWLDHMFRQVVAPMMVTCDDPAGFRGSIKSTALGPVHVSAVGASPCEAYRTSQMIRRSDPELFQLAFNLRGETTITQDRRCAPSQPSDLVLYHTSRPHQVRTRQVRTGLDEYATRGVMVVFPATLLPLPPHKVERLTATPLSGREGVGALLAGFLTRMTAGTDRYGAVESLRLGGILIDLLTTVLAHRLNADATVPPETRRHTLLLRIHAFIQQHLADPNLSPATISAAHDISIRTLHRLFQTQEATVAAWIRDQRLRHCRRDLRDPLLGHRSIHAIATRWGFTDLSRFSHTFRNAYGLSPREYRHQPDAGSPQATAHQHHPGTSP
ncbi:helix-turn-helix domain-containing protein [Streptosporangium sp. NBC_01495]|uniref:helix-turn-helix domain-containing protein n=1 Tax=Streptosporangium sp. NBC_01495 TaxID=2903899 RepID=UPI002E2F695B|nr:helix-turn-helix domain-containing protein [Streptosporangium sp. NBC_01495]